MEKNERKDQQQQQKLPEGDAGKRQLAREFQQMTGSGTESETAMRQLGDRYGVPRGTIMTALSDSRSGALREDEQEPRKQP